MRKIANTSELELELQLRTLGTAAQGTSALLRG
jgi:hypothetical protein